MSEGAQIAGEGGQRGDGEARHDRDEDAEADATTEAIPLTPQAQGTPSAWSAERRRRPIGMAMPSGIPSGASSATVIATRAANGRSISARSSGSSPRRAAAIRPQATVSATVQRPARIADPAREQRAQAR